MEWCHISAASWSRATAASAVACGAWSTGTCWPSSCTGTRCTWPRNTTGKCSCTVRTPEPGGSCGHGCSTSGHTRPSRWTTRCTRDRACRVHPDAGSGHRTRVTVPNTPGPWCREPSVGDRTVSAGSCICSGHRRAFCPGHRHRLRRRSVPTAVPWVGPATVPADLAADPVHSACSARRPCCATCADRPRCRPSPWTRRRTCLWGCHRSNGIWAVSSSTSSPCMSPTCRDTCIPVSSPIVHAET